jgi:hypothetical protein
MRMHDGWKPGRGVHNTVRPISDKHQEIHSQVQEVNMNQRFNNLSKVKCTSHEYEERR